jgi:hypothetical protein
MGLKGMIVIALGMFIDALQAAFAWMFVSIGAGLQALTPVGGAIGGAAAGASYCYYATTGVTSALVAGAKCGVGGAIVGAAASTFGIPLGTALAFASDVCISLTMGAGFILLLCFMKMYYPMTMGVTYVIEAIPGLDVIPAWTFLAIRCVMLKYAENKTSGSFSFATGVAGAILSPAGAAIGFGSVARRISSIQGATGRMARGSSVVKEAYETEDVQDIARGRQQLVADVKTRINSDITPHAPQQASQKQLYAKAA